jgi:hypothetical protein
MYKTVLLVLCYYITYIIIAIVHDNNSISVVEDGLAGCRDWRVPYTRKVGEAN